MRLSRRAALAAAAGSAALPGLRGSAAAGPRVAGALLPDPQALFTAGEAGYVDYRIPSLCVPAAGVVLAFCEARGAGGDAASAKIVMRRSTDGGATFGAMRTIMYFGTENTGSNVVVVDPRSRDVVLLACRRSAGVAYEQVTAGDPRQARIYVKRSTDDGETWQPAVEITDQVRRPEWRWYATGPGVGVALTTGPHAGRIVIPANHTRTPTVRGDTGSENRYAGSHLLYSDQGGRPGSWRIGAISANPDGTVNEDETAATVLADGQTLYLSCRCGREDRAPGNRADTYSDDGGGTHRHPFRTQATITTPVCQGSLLTLPDGRLVYGGPSLPDFRAAMALSVSSDNGRTWYLRHKVSGLAAGYSSLALVDRDTIGLLYETGDFSNSYRRIEFEQIPVAALG